MFTRRTFLTHTAALLGALGLPRRGVAGSITDRKFVFVFANGGWDPTGVFAPLFGMDGIDLETDAESRTEGGIEFVSHPERPSVDAFFAGYHSQALVLNGLQVPSVTHDLCRKLVLTGVVESNVADWPTLISLDQESRYAVPSVVLTGPSYPGYYGTVMARVGQSSQLDTLLSGDVFGNATVELSAPSALSETLVDAHLGQRMAGRIEAAVADSDLRLSGQVEKAHARLMALKAERDQVVLEVGQDFLAQAQSAVDVLSTGIARCVTISRNGWDTHGDNYVQSELYEDTFGGLLELMAGLESTPGFSAPSLADETVVVVISEMGRAPLINARNGKDHWPHTSAMLVGPGLQTDRVVGGFDDRLNSIRMNVESGVADEQGDLMTPDHLGAVLLTLADIDPAERLPGVPVVGGLLS